MAIISQENWHLINAINKLEKKHGSEIFHQDFSFPKVGTESYIPKYQKNLTLEEILNLYPKLSSKRAKKFNFHLRKPIKMRKKFL